MVGMISERWAWSTRDDKFLEEENISLFMRHTAVKSKPLRCQKNLVNVSSGCCDSQERIRAGEGRGQLENPKFRPKR